MNQVDFNQLFLELITAHKRVLATTSDLNTANRAWINAQVDHGVRSGVRAGRKADNARNQVHAIPTAKYPTLDLNFAASALKSAESADDRAIWAREDIKKRISTALISCGYNECALFPTAMKSDLKDAKDAIVMDQNEEIRGLLVKHMSTSDDREKQRVNREEIRAEADARFKGEVMNSLKSLQGKQAEHEQKFKDMESDTDGKFRKVLVSITEGDDAVLAKVADHNKEVVGLLKGQNEAAALKEKLEADIAQKNESMRARHKIETIKAKSPLWLGIIGLAGLAVSNITNCKATQDAHAQSEKSISTLAAKVDAIPQAVATANIAGIANGNASYSHYTLGTTTVAASAPEASASTVVVGPATTAAPKAFHVAAPAAAPVTASSPQNIDSK